MMARSTDTGSDQRDGILHAGLVAWSLLGIIGLASMLAAGLYLVRDVFPPLALALLVIFLLNPIVNRLQRRGIGRGLGTALIYFLFIGSVALLILFVAPPLGRQIDALRDRAPEITERVLDSVQNVADKFGVEFNSDDIRSFFGLGTSTDGSGTNDSGTTSGDGTTGTTDGAATANEERIRENISLLTRLLSGVQGVAGQALHLMLVFVLGPIFALYLLIDLPKIQARMRHYIPPRYRDELEKIFETSAQAVGAFFRGQLLVALIVGVMASAALLAIGLPFWLPIGMTAGFFNIIPLVGPFIGGGLAVVVAAFTGGADQALYAAGLMLVIQQIDNHLISPNVMGRATRLHPVVVMVALLIGGTLAGLWGMLLAVPAAAVMRVLGVHYYETRVLGTPLDEVYNKELEPDPVKRKRPRKPPKASSAADTV